MDTLYQKSLKAKSGTVLDFGEHMTGYVTFTIQALRGTPDAPVRVKFTFGEVPAELATPFDPYTGDLSRAWLQDEVVTLTELPVTMTIPRRLSFRYAKIDLLGASAYFDLHLTGISCRLLFLRCFGLGTASPAIGAKSIDSGPQSGRVVVVWKGNRRLSGVICL